MYTSEFDKNSNNSLSLFLHLRNTKDMLIADTERNNFTFTEGLMEILQTSLTSTKANFHESTKMGSLNTTQQVHSLMAPKASSQWLSKDHINMLRGN